MCVCLCVCVSGEGGERERDKERERESTRAYLCQCFILKKYTTRVWKDRTDNIRVNPWVFHSHGRVERWNNRWKYRPEVVSCNCQVILRSYNLQHLRPTVTNRKIFLQIPQALRISSANLILSMFLMFLRWSSTVSGESWSVFAQLQANFSQSDSSSPLVILVDHHHGGGICKALHWVPFEAPHVTQGQGGP